MKIECIIAMLRAQVVALEQNLYLCNKAKRRMHEAQLNHLPMQVIYFYTDVDIWNTKRNAKELEVVIPKVFA